MFPKGKMLNGIFYHPLARTEGLSFILFTCSLSFFYPEVLETDQIFTYLLNLT